MGVITEEFDFLIDNTEDNSTFIDDSNEMIKRAQEFIEQARKYPNRTKQGIQLSNIVDCITIGKSDIYNEEHVIFTLNVNKLKDVSNGRLIEFEVPSFVEELKSIGYEDGNEFGYNQSHRNYLKTIVIPKNLKIIAPNTFAFYKNLENIIFEDSCKLLYIGSQAFACCGKLHSVNFQKCKELEDIPNDIFDGSNIEVLKLPDGFNYNMQNTEIKTIYIGKEKYNTMG